MQDNTYDQIYQGFVEAHQAAFQEAEDRKNGIPPTLEKQAQAEARKERLKRIAAEKQKHLDDLKCNPSSVGCRYATWDQRMGEYLQKTGKKVAYTDVSKDEDTFWTVKGQSWDCTAKADHIRMCCAKAKVNCMLLAIMEADDLINKDSPKCSKALGQHESSPPVKE